MLRKFALLDRRWIYLLMALAVLIPLLKPMRIAIKPSAPVIASYEALNAVQEGSAVLFSFDYGPGTKVELHPMAVAGLHLAFRRNLKVVTMALDPAGQALAAEALRQVAPAYDKREGEDYLNLGYKAGNEAVVISMGLDFRGTFSSDARGNSIESSPLMAKIRGLSDFALVASWSAGRPGAIDHVRNTATAYGRPLIVGVTAVQSPEFYPFLKSGQVKGLLGGLRAAAELETLVNVTGTATPAMDAQSVAHFLLIFLILMSNVAYFAQKRAERS